MRPLKNSLWLVLVLTLGTSDNLFAGGEFSDDFEDNWINTDHWDYDGERRDASGAPAGSWSYTHEETVYDEGDPDGYLRMAVTSPGSAGSNGAEAWIRTTYNYKHGISHLVNFKWKAEADDGHGNGYFIQITDGYVPPSAWWQWPYFEPRLSELDGTIDLLWTWDATSDRWFRGGWLWDPEAGPNPDVPQGEPETWSIAIDRSGTARLYNGPDGTGSLLGEEALDPSYPWYVRLMVLDATSGAFGAGAAQLNLYSFSAVPEPSTLSLLGAVAGLYLLGCAWRRRKGVA